jgi:hypothetical protein
MTPGHRRYVELLRVTEVLRIAQTACSSQMLASPRNLGTGLGDRFSERDRPPSAMKGNKKGHLLAFCEAL